MVEGLNVSPEVLKERAVQISNKLTQIETVLNNVTEAVGRVPDAFEGKASSEFQSKYANLTKSYGKFSGKMQEYVTFLNKTAAAYSQMDTEIANIANQNLSE